MIRVHSWKCKLFVVAKCWCLKIFSFWFFSNNIHKFFLLKIECIKWADKSIVYTYNHYGFKLPYSLKWTSVFPRGLTGLSLLGGNGFDAPLILGRVFLATVVAVFDFLKNKILFASNDENVYYKDGPIDKSIHISSWVSVINGYIHVYVSQGSLRDNITCASVFFLFHMF